MSMPVGCKTEIFSTVVRRQRPMNDRITIEQDWILHPTKGWRRGQKRKKIEAVTWRGCWPRIVHETKWKSWR